MTVLDLNEVCKDCIYVMTNYNTGESIQMCYEQLKEQRICRTSELKIKDIYDDCGVVAELKFDKFFFKNCKNLLTN